MGLGDMFRGQFIDIIEWLDDSRDTIVWRFPRHENEIKMGAQLVVRESQTAVFVNEGQVADVFSPGTHTLETQNLPILSTLKGWKYGFESPFKAEVYFVNMRQFTDLKWGTQNPVIVRDAEFGMVRLRAFGAYSMRVTDPKKLLTELAGTDPQFRTEEVSDFIRQMIVSKLGTALATSGVSMLDLATQQQSIGQRVAGILSEDLANQGITIATFIIENISVPPEVEEAIDKRTRMGVVGDLDTYTKFQTAEAIEKAAENPGAGGMGVGIGLGTAIGQQMGNQVHTSASAAPSAATAGAAAAATPPPIPVVQWFLGIDGTQHGPFEATTLPTKVSEGLLTPDTLVWTAGMANWEVASKIPAMAPVLSIAPPPLPLPAAAAATSASGAPASGESTTAGASSGQPDSVNHDTSTSSTDAGSSTQGQADGSGGTSSTGGDGF